MPATTLRSSPLRSTSRTIKKEWESADAERSGFLERNREAAALTIPSVLPDEGLRGEDEILKSFQNVGADGVSNLVGRLIIALFPPGVRWFQFSPSVSAIMAPNVTPEALDQFRGLLYERELTIQTKMDATNYRTKQRVGLQQLLVVGNSLLKLDDDYRLKCYRLDQWVQRRTSTNDVHWLITREEVDPLDLTEAEIAQAHVDIEQEEPLELYTKAFLQRNGKWRIQQELNSEIIRDAEEPVSPFLPAGYEELPGEDYSRGFVELKIGDLRSLNGLWKALLDGMVAVTKIHPVCDDTKGFRPSDIMKPNGTPIVGRVEGGEPTGIAFLQSKKVADLSVAMQGTDRIEKRLGKSMLLESSMQPQGERVTATAVMRIAKEVEGALGGVYAQIAEEVQRPFLERFVWQMERDKLLEPIRETDKRLIQTHILTGLEALGRHADVERLLTALQIVAQIPEALQRVRMDVAVAQIFRGFSLDTKRLLKTDEELNAEQQAAAQQQMRQAADAQTIETAGRVVETAAASAGQNQSEAA